MSRKSRKQASRGTIALCLTIGVIVGLGEALIKSELPQGTGS